MSDPRQQLMEVFKAQGWDLPEDLEARVDYLVYYASAAAAPANVEPILAWLWRQRQQCGMTLQEIPMDQVARWKVDPQTGEISHETGEFFRVVGIKVGNAQAREASGWCQPMIHQKAMGILGILVQRQDGVDRYLLQAKFEPGNIDRVQLSPTLQSTVSNLRRAHGGSKSRWAEYFESPRPGSVIYKKYQVEDGGRFYLKSNLNMLVRLPADEVLELPSDFIWVTMAELKGLLQHENVVNIAVRSIISPIW